MTNFLKPKKSNFQSIHRGDNRKLKYYDQLLKKHDFWDKQPTLRDDFKQVEHGSIEGERKVEDVPKEPQPLPEPNLKWCQLNIQDAKEVDEVIRIQFSSIIS